MNRFEKIEKELEEEIKMKKDSLEKENVLSE